MRDMRLLLILVVIGFAGSASADLLDDDPYGHFRGSQRKTDEMRADWMIIPPPSDADEATLNSYYIEVEERDEARRRLQKDAEFRLRKLEERQEELERRDLWQDRDSCWP